MVSAAVTREVHLSKGSASPGPITRRIRWLESPTLISCFEIGAEVRRRGQSKRIIGRSLLCQCPRRAFRLALCINAVLLLGGCGVNYRFCPPGTEKDPSRPFTTCKTTTPAKNRSFCFAVDRFDADAPSGIARRGVTMPVREMTKIVEHEIHDIVLCSRFTTSRRKDAPRARMSRPMASDVSASELCPRCRPA
jgi:hypothetical protein